MHSLQHDAIRDFLYSEPVFSPAAACRLRLADGVTGWVAPDLAEALLTLLPSRCRRGQGGLHLPLDGADYTARSQELQALAQTLRAVGLVGGWRDEAMMLRDDKGRPFAEVERAALRALGLPTVGVHLNALVQTADGAEMWVAQRSHSKAVDPGLLDNLVGGGVIGRESIADTLTREAWEEAGLRLARPLRPQRRLHVLRRSAHGVQDETLYVHDLWLPARFQPENHDGELAGTQRLPLSQVLASLQLLHFTRDAALVILDGLCRLCFFGAETPAIAQLLSDFGLYPGQ